MRNHALHKNQSINNKNMDKITKFRIEQSTEISEYFKTYGYVVISKAISDEKIGAFIEAYESVKKKPFFVYYSQSIHIATRPELNAHSFIKESMQNASRLALFKSFSTRIQSCIYDRNVSDALSCISDSNTHISWQNMFFDQSTGTIEHQDSWYLDTEPPGKLIGVWYALEDIDKDSGPFFVIPESHKIGLLDRKEFPDHEDFVTATQKRIRELNIEKKKMCLSKGDILLWHPYLIHGAFICDDTSKSRKSFTSHFYPDCYKAKDTESEKLLSTYNHKSPKKTLNTQIYTAYRFSDYFFNLLVYALYLKNALLKGRKLSMRREDYS